MMNREEVRQYQMAQLRLLEYFDSVCTSMGLKYYLVFGTLLGAVRHKGFIPWDADIDVAMFREDYETLKKEFIKQPNDMLFYQHYESEKNHSSPHAVLKIKGTHVYFNKVNASNYKPLYDGIYIDLFPIDNVSEDVKLQNAQVNRIARIRRFVSYKLAPVYSNTSAFGKFVKLFISFVLKLISFHALFQKADKVMQKYDSNKNTKHVAILTDPLVFKKQLFPRSVFGDGKFVDFEGKKFRVPVNAELFLSIRYGNYMELPPEKDRWKYLENAISKVDYGNTTFLDSLEEV